MLEAQSKMNTFGTVTTIPNFWDNIRQELLNTNVLTDISVPNVHRVIFSHNCYSDEFLYALHGALCLKQCQPPFDVVKMLIELFPDALYKRTVTGMTALHLAVKNGINIDVVTFILIKYPIAAKTLTPCKNQLPLHFVKSANVTNLLLSEFPAGTSCSESNGNLPLHSAVSCDEVSAEVVAILLHTNYNRWLLEEEYQTEHGGVLVCNKEKESPMSIALERFRTSIILIKSEKLVKLQWNKISLCLSILSFSDERYKAGTILHIALSILKEEFLQQYAVIRCQHEVNKLDSLGRYPLFIAMMNENISIHVIRRLVDIFPQATCHLDKEKFLPLHHAILCGRNFEDGINYLVEKAPNSLTCIDHNTGLFPFMISANKCNLNTTYRLLRQNPNVIFNCFQI